MAGFLTALQFRDNSGKRAEMRCILPASLSTAQLATFVNGWAAVAQPLSDAAIYGAEVRYAFNFPPGPAPSPSSSVYTRLICIFGNGTYRGVLSIPSPRSLSLDLDGDFRAIRASRERLLLLGVLPALETALAGAIIPDGRPFPTLYTVGGIDTLRGD